MKKGKKSKKHENYKLLEKEWKKEMNSLENLAWEDEVINLLEEGNILSIINNSMINTRFLEMALMRYILKEKYEVAMYIKNIFDYIEHEFNPFDNPYFEQNYYTMNRI